MIRHHSSEFFLLVLPLVLLLAGCAQPPSPRSSGPEHRATPAMEKHLVPSPSARTPEPLTDEPSLSGLDRRRIVKSEATRARCYNLQPARVAKRKDRRMGGRCQPQSLIYARCRTGLLTCRLGDTSPVQWFSCARKNGNTTLQPTAGSVMVLAANARRGMPTGHPAYVEKIKAVGDGTWLLRISHTNYDRKCHLNLDAEVVYDPGHMTATFRSGPWQPWARNLKVLGFILR